MKNNFHNREIAVSSLLEFVDYIVLIDLIFSPNKHCLLSCRMSEKKNFMSWFRNAIISYLPGKKGQLS